MFLVCCFAPLFEFSVKNAFGPKPNDTAELHTLLGWEGSGPLCPTRVPHIKHRSIPNRTGPVNGFKLILGDVTTWCHPLERG